MSSVGVKSPQRVSKIVVVEASSAIRNDGQADQAAPDHPADALIILGRLDPPAGKQNESAAASTAKPARIDARVTVSAG